MAVYLGDLSGPIAAASARVAEAAANPGDDKYNLAREQSTLAWLQSPSFCGPGPSTEEYEEYRRTGIIPTRDAGKMHPDAKNPGQCEVAWRHELVAQRFYRESPMSLLKNLGAGVVNAIVPGSDLGDAGSSTQLLGQAIGTVAGLFVNPGKLVEASAKAVLTGLQASKVSVFSAIGNAISKASSAVTSFATTPLGQFVGQTGVQLVQKQLAQKAAANPYAPLPYYMPGMPEEQRGRSVSAGIIAGNQAQSLDAQVKLGSTTVSTGNGGMDKNLPYILGGLALLYFLTKKGK